MPIPYQDPQGNYIMGGNVVPKSQYDLWVASQANMPQQAQQGLGSVAAPTHPSGQSQFVAPVDPMAAYIAEDIARREMFQNPIGAGTRSTVDYLRGLVN